jgi:hypothetical protein
MIAHCTGQKTNKGGGDPIGKKIFLTACYLCLVSGFIFAQQEPAARRFAVGLGLEVNNNNPKGAAMGVMATGDWRLHRFIAVGAKVGFSSNFGKSNTLEAGAIARFVLPVKSLEFFAHGGIGISGIFFYAYRTPRLLGEGGVGVRIPLPLNNFYIEPAARFGHPFFWGAGVTVGYRF